MYLAQSVITWRHSPSGIEIWLTVIVILLWQNARKLLKGTHKMRYEILTDVYLSHTPLLVTLR